MPLEPEEVILLIIEPLEKLNVPYLIGGSLKPLPCTARLSWMLPTCFNGH